MRTYITTLILCLLISGVGISKLTQDSKQVSISGNWESVLKLGETKLRLVLKISDGPNGQLQAVGGWK